MWRIISMKNILIAFLFLMSSLQVSADVFYGDDSDDIDYLFDWAEIEYPGLFPSEEMSRVADPWYYRYYSATENYLGFNLTYSGSIGDASIFVAGNSFDGIMKVDSLNNLLTHALLTLSYSEFTSDLLDNKIFYWVVYDDFGYNDIGKKWNLAKIEFTSSTSLILTEINTPDSTHHSIEYIIDSDGILIVDPYNEGGDTIRLMFETIDFLSLCNGYSCLGNDEIDRSYYYYDMQKAIDFANASNAETTRQ
jgi:hypothetical protein